MSRGRATVKAVWDAVAARASLVLREGDRRDGDTGHRAPIVASSITKLAEVRGLQAAIVLDAGWAGLWAARRLADEGHPVLWMSEWPATDSGQFHGVGRDLIVPGLVLRYVPATLRLRELIATQLGAVQAIDVVVPANGFSHETIDWATSIANSRVIESTHDAKELVIHLKSGVTANFRTGDALSATVQCEAGTARWTPPNGLEWQNTHRGDWTTVRTADDRDGPTVLLDLFLRRVVGVLVPVPSVNDVAAAQGVLKLVNGVD